MPSSLSTSVEPETISLTDHGVSLTGFVSWPGHTARKGQEWERHCQATPISAFPSRGSAPASVWASNGRDNRTIAASLHCLANYRASKSCAGLSLTRYAQHPCRVAQGPVQPMSMSGLLSRNVHAMQRRLRPRQTGARRGAAAVLTGGAGKPRVAAWMPSGPSRSRSPEQMDV